MSAEKNANQDAPREAPRDALRISGKRFEFPRVPAGWSFELRPGGVWIASRSGGSAGSERVRLVVRERQEKLSAWVAGRSFSGQIARAARAGAGGASGDSDLVAQFPGKVRKVLVAEGQEVREGEPLVLVEAMKMEFAVRAPAGGKIRSVLVREGQQLSPGDRFVDFE